MLVDDHEVVRLGLRALFSQTGNVEVVAEAGTVADAIERAAKHRPDLVLMDLRLPDGTGLDACRDILSANPDTRVLFLTSHSDE
jgi:DNA-binding NarL/FixJ family response regulator